MSPVEVKALSACGLTFSTDYRLLKVDTGIPRLKVYLPTAPDPTGRDPLGSLPTVPVPTVAGG